MTSTDVFFKNNDRSRTLFEAVRREIDGLHSVEMRVGKSPVSFRRRKAFAWVWMPDRYLHGKAAPLVLTLSLPRRDPSPRWKEVVEPVPGRFTHHLELFSFGDIDSQVRDWIREAWGKAE